MWKSKKFILIAVLVVLVLVGSLAGVALVQAETGDTGQSKTLFARVATILGIDQQKVENAFAQAQREMREEALDNYLKEQVAQGKITQEQADQYKKWVQSKPDMAPYQQQLKDWQQTKPGIPPELKKWQESIPNIPAPGPFGGYGRGGMMGGGGRFFWGK